MVTMMKDGPALRVETLMKHVLPQVAKQKQEVEAKHALVTLQLSEQAGQHDKGMEELKRTLAVQVSS